MNPPPPLSAFDSSARTYLNRTRAVYRMGSGTDGAAPTQFIDAEVLLRMCVSAEFAVFAANGSSPVVEWLRELCKEIAVETRGPVMSEPSLPFPLPFTKDGAAMHGPRFTGDSRCKVERFDAYQELLGERFARIEIKSPDTSHGIAPDAHSVLTQELSDAPGHPTWAAFEAVVAFLKSNLPMQ